LSLLSYMGLKTKTVGKLSINTPPIDMVSYLAVGCESFLRVGG
jgi:hypothetical protein